MIPIIAEIGSAWRFGSGLDDSHAQQAISVAKLAGAQMVKFQWTSNGAKLAQRRHLTGNPYGLLEWRKDLFDVMAKACAVQQIEFLCTVFLPEDVAMIKPYVQRFKVASLEYQAKDLYAAFDDRPIIASCGATTDRELYAVASRLRPQDRVLHCVCAYPAPAGQLNLRVLQTTHCSGLSDHSGDLMTGAIAAACGAKLLEVHFRLDRTPRENPDFPHALAPAQLARYIQNVRKAEAMLGDGQKIVQPCEQPMLRHRVIV